MIAQEHLIQPLLKRLAQLDQPWSIEEVLRDDARKERLQEILGAEIPPSVLLTVSHGMPFRHGHSRQRAEQGAIVCQNWPGYGPVLGDYYFTGDDIPKHADLRGMVAFIFAEFGAGTPSTGDFEFMTGFDRRMSEPQAPQSFVARLPQKLLSHAGGGALAVIGHVDKAWTSSFSGKLGELDVIAAVLTRLMAGYPVGFAAERFAERYAAFASELAGDLPALMSGNAFSQHELGDELRDKVVAAFDARNWVIFGDPAVHIRLGS